MQKPSFFALLCLLPLLGLGCRSNPPLPVPSEEPVVIEEPSDENDGPCSGDTVLYTHTDPAAPGLSFCHSKTSESGEPVSIARTGNTTVISAGDEPPDTIIVLPAEDTDMTEYLREHFMTAENREHCDVVWVEEGNMRVYGIGSENSKDECGSASHGTFYQRTDEPEWLLYVVTETDAILPGNNWIQTMRGLVEGKEKTEEEPIDDWFVEGSLAHYEDKEMGVAFDYPERWGPVQRTVEGDGTGACEYLRGVMFTGLGIGATGVAAVAKQDTCVPLGRGGFFVDRATNFHPDLTHEEQCDNIGATVCETLKTDAGQPLWHWHYDELEVWGTIYPNVDEYGTFHPDHPLGGIILSNERLVFYGLDPMTKQFRALAESLTVVDLAP